jgi:Ca2+-binding EF-hand superfamily protein
VINTTGECPNRRVPRFDFKAAIESQGVSLTQDEGKMMGANLVGEDGCVDFDKFYCELTGGLNDSRMACVHKTFSKLDLEGCGSVSSENLRVAYNVSSHPGVIAGKITEDEAFLEFLVCFPDKNNNGRVCYTEFCDYYAGVSSIICNDGHFDQLM